MTPSARRVAVLGVLMVASAFDLALLAGRIVHSGQRGYAFLAWNLVLAWIPLLLALVVYDGYRRNGWRLRYVPAAILWLLFLPNAPYVLTDFIHLRSIDGAPVWFDAALVAGFAFTGVLLGFVSLALMHAVAQRLGGAMFGWSFVAVALGLCSVGIYVGRFLRFNSWSALTSPGRLLDLTLYRLGDPFGNALLLEVMVVFTGFLVIGYLIVWTLARPTVELDGR
jgi:uncharacterized membrane protein